MLTTIYDGWAQSMRLLGGEWYSYGGEYWKSIRRRSVPSTALAFINFCLEPVASMCCLARQNGITICIVRSLKVWKVLRMKGPDSFFMDWLLTVGRRPTMLLVCVSVQRLPIYCMIIPCVTYLSTLTQKHWPVRCLMSARATSLMSTFRPDIVKFKKEYKHNSHS